MKVLQVHNAYAGSLGGEDITVAQERELLEAAGHVVRPYEVTNPSRGLGAAAAFATSPWNPRSARRLAAELAEFEPDVAHIHNLWFALSPSVLRPMRATGTRVVMTLHNFRLVCLNGYLHRDGHLCEDCVGHLPWRGVWHRCYRDSAPASAMSALAVSANRGLRTWSRYVDVFTAYSDFAASRLHHGGVPADRIVVKRNFVPDPGPRSIPAEGARSVLYVGRLDPEKGIADVVEAWRHGSPAGLELTVCGDGPLRDKLEQDAPEGVRFTGWLPRAEVVRLMIRARASVFPSRMYEGGNPLAVLESFAAGLPVLASDIGAGAELARALGPEWVTPEGNIERWSEALIRLEDDSRIRRASRLSREHYESDFSPRRALAALEAIYGASGVPATGASTG